MTSMNAGHGKLLLLSLILLGNGLIFGWRYYFQAGEIPGVGPNIAELGEAQVEMVIDWRNASAVPLTTTAIQEFARQMKWGICPPLPASAEEIPPDQISIEDRGRLCEAVAELIGVYGRGDPFELYDHMQTNCGPMPPEMVASLRTILTQDGSTSNAALADRKPRELFRMVAHKVDYASRWESLVKDSACASFWRSELTLIEILNQRPIGSEMVGTFRNQTRYHHLFGPAVSGPTAGIERESAGAASILADVQFVVKHDPVLMSEPSPYLVRFLWDDRKNVWRPIELIHVGTISGKSPTLLF